MKNIYLYISLLLITALVISCDEKNDIKIESPEFESTLNDNIVIDEDLSISYQIPLNWNEMPASLSDKFVARLSGKDKNNLIVYSPKSFYYDENTSSLLRVGKVSLKDNSVPKVLTIDTYVELFKKYNANLIVERNETQYSQLNVIELKIEKGNLISFKIVFYNGAKEIIQLDFSITKENTFNLKSTIDASIKSIKLL